jgi:hypothetical protein
MPSIELKDLILKGVNFAAHEGKAHVKIVLEGESDESCLYLAEFTGQPVKVTVLPMQLSFEDAKRAAGD